VFNIVAGLLSILILAVSVGGYVVVTWFDGSIARVHLNLGQDRPVSAAAGSQNWLLVGTDSRAGSSGQFGNVPGERSDTTILAHLDADGTTTNVSFPRDTLVTVPAYRNGKGQIVPAHKDKFNSAILDGGPSLLVRTVEALVNIRIDHYVSVDLEGFSKISKALNGVPVCILASDHTEIGPDGGIITNISDGYSGFHGKVGDQTVVGDQATAFVRQRHGLPDPGDLSRIKRQQQFLGSVFRTATRVNLLFNPLAITRLLAAIKDALTLDQQTSLTDLEKLGLRLRGVDPAKIIFETIPTRGITTADTDLGTLTGDPNAPSLTPTGQTKDVGNVLLLDRDGFDAMIAKLKGETAPVSAGAPNPPSPTVAIVTLQPSGVLVTVEDGVGRAGLASHVTQALGKEGFRTGAPGPADRTGYTKTEVLYARGNQDAANTVAAAVPGAVLKEDPSATSGVVLIVGSNYTTVLPVTASGSTTATPTAAPAPSPTASASPAAPVVTAASASNRCTY
jgi:LCP family protein required for cell wall assembly